MLSDSAKRVLFRERELELLRRTIEDDLSRGDFNAALILCDDMARLGYAEEAEAFRTRVLPARNEQHETVIHESLRSFDELLQTRDWSAAYLEASRLRRLYPESHLLHGITQRIEDAKADHKHHLEDAFREAAARDDVSKAMKLLRELDLCITREEARQLTPIAKGVIDKHRNYLEIQFKMAVSDHRWQEAAEIGATIIEDFPNTKMADEVRSMIDVIRTRASRSTVDAGTTG